MDYFFPKGWKRFGLNVMNKNYDGGKMDWFGMNNGPNEWAVAYHGTKFEFLKSIGETGLRRGDGQVHNGNDNIHPLSKI